MKFAILFAFVTSLAFASAKGGEADHFGLIINGKTYKSGDAVPKEDLKAIANFTIIDLISKRIYKPIDFEWIVSFPGNIYKNESDSRENWKRLDGLVDKMDDSGVFFIDNIRLNDSTIPIPKEFHLKIK